MKLTGALTEIEEWEQQEHDEPEGYYSNPDPYLEAHTAVARPSQTQFLV